ncbi:pilin [Patescibacteria group bacterium]|nr:pilin [Patescibacteria group bacterium]
MIKFIKISLGFSILGLVILPGLAYAQILPPCTATGNCGICDFLQTFVNIIRWVLGILGGSALFLLIWHGFTWLSSAGNKERVDAGKKGLIHTVIGLVIIIGSWFLVNLTLVLLLTSTEQASQGQVVQSLFSGNVPWYQYCQGAGNAFCQQGWGEGTPCGSGKFCLKRVGSDNKPETTYSCSNKGANNQTEYENACHYWACHPTRKEYQYYNCVSDANDCVSGKILGPEYCSGSGMVCCERQDKQKYQCPGVSQSELSSCFSVSYISQDSCEEECPDWCESQNCPNYQCEESSPSYQCNCSE